MSNEKDLTPQEQGILKRQAILQEWYAEEPDEEKARLLAERDAAVALIEEIEAEVRISVSTRTQVHLDWLVAKIENWRNRV